MTQSPEPVTTFELLRARPDDTPNIRNLRYAVIGMGVILLAGFVAVLARIAYLAQRPVGSDVAAVTAVARPVLAAPLATEIRLALPAGAKVRSQSLDGNRLAVHYEMPTVDGKSGEGKSGEGIMIIDLQTGSPVSQVTITPSQR
jgi:hypothetical protein